jgi:hypothetical protein
MNFHFVPETVTQGQGVPLSIAVPLLPLWIFTLSQKLWPKDRVAHFQEVPLRPLWIFTLSQKLWPKDKETHLQEVPFWALLEFSLCPAYVDTKIRKPTDKTWDRLYFLGIIWPFLGPVNLPNMLFISPNGTTKNEGLHNAHNGDLQY